MFQGDARATVGPLAPASAAPRLGARRRALGAAEVHWYAGGDRLPIGIEAHAGREHDDLVLWKENVRAVIAGDSLVDFGTGFALNEWLRSRVTRQQIVEGLRPLLDRTIEVVCPAHGAPTDRAALRRALSL